MENYEQERLLIELFRQLSPTNQQLTIDCTRELLNDQFQEQVAQMVETDVITGLEAARLIRSLIERSI